MSVYKIADVNIKIEPKSDYVRRLFSEYITDSAEYDFDATATDEEIAKEKEAISDFSIPMCESVVIFAKVCDKTVSDYNGVLLHSAAVLCGGKAYLFSAPAGTGKTTHARLLKKRYGDKIKILNGDKPLLRIVDGKIIVYGSPWRGKENYGFNSSAPLGGIFVLSRGEVNRCERIDSSKALKALLPETVVPDNFDGQMKALDFLDTMLKQTEIYSLECNTDITAAEASMRVMKNFDIN